MKKLAIIGSIAFILVGSYGCDQSQKNTDRQQPSEQSQAEAAAQSGYGSDSTGTNEDTTANQTAR